MSLLSRIAVEAARGFGLLASADKTKVVADYLVVAGGGGGGAVANNSAGGGGAGGLLTSTATLSTLNTYSIAVGAGGAGGANGTNSIVSGTGLTTITSTGGGRGSSQSYAASSGGSGGGGSYFYFTTGAAGTSGQGFAGGNGVSSSSRGGGGGGGSSSVGVNATISPAVAGNGGSGTASSISGSSVTYAGGGGGGEEGGTRGTGQAGGGNGGNVSNNCTSATANSGSGGGGVGGNQPSSTTFGSGGSGIVIISYTSATPKFVGGTITTSGGKQIHTFTSSGTLSPITPITASYLVVAGGGGGGAERNGGGSGGGGAGGLLTSSTTLYSGATYVVTVGGGGAGAAAANPANSGTQGSNSVLSGTGLTTLTATGGGFGGAQSTSTVGGNGGSGGGGWSGGASPPYAGGTGTSGQGNNGGSGNTTGNTGGGGGGGASAVGGSWSGTNGSNNGGAGTASSITGSSVTYAGGGGGGVGAGTASTGGTGGGGAGGVGAGGSGTSGTTNLGGGGGGAGGNNATPGAGGSGGSGVVIISYAGSQAFNGGLVTSSGGNTIHTFTSTGALTPLTNNLTNSLRFRSSASAYLNRTLTSNTNRRISTLSFWTKLGSSTGTTQTIFSAAANGSSFSDVVEFLNGNTFRILFDAGANYGLITTQVFRDFSAWYHIVIAIDTTQSTASNRVKMYVNGNQITAFSTELYPVQNYNPNINSATIHNIGRNTTGAGYQDGYLADINFIDGQALEPYYFGNNDANGVWKPIAYKGTYGTNGFYLTFGNTTSTTTLGFDSSPNGNNWTTNNISLTAGVTYDAMTDVPTNTSATTANYAVMTPAYLPRGSYTLSEANLKCSGAYASSNYPRIMSSMGMTSGKYYWEYVGVTFPATESCSIGIKEVSSAYPSATGGLGAVSGEIGLFNTGRLDNNGSTTVGFSTTFTTGDVIGMAFDATNGTLNYYKNGSAIGSQITGIAAGTYAPAFDCLSTSQTVWCVNYGQRPFAQTPPTNYVALNTFNLPTPTILQGNRFMDATLYTGQGVVQTVVNAGQFRPDFVWQKPRNEVASHRLVDSVRGVNNVIYSNQTAAQSTETTTLTAFNSNGFTGGGSNAVSSGNTAVAWQWQAGQGSTSSNTSGSITSTVSVNTTAGFSIVTYTGTGANATVGHGLGVAPRMIICKNRASATDWAVYHASVGNTGALRLNLNAATETDSRYWNNTTPTSTVFSVGSSSTVNGSSNTQVAYCWSEISGFSRFGSYVGNGSTDGPFIYTNFRPEYILIKNTTNYDWHIFDATRNSFNLTNSSLKANTTGTEFTNNDVSVDLLSNGFKLRGTDLAINGNGNTHIFAAFAENPFKISNAR